MKHSPSLNPQATHCPKCARPRPPAALECPSCGIVFARFRLPVPTPRAVKVLRPPFVPPAKVEALLLLVASTLEAGATLQSLGRGESLRSLPRPTAERLWMDADLGVPLSTSLTALRLLDPASLALIKAKEAHGALPAALRQVADRIAERRRRRAQLLFALAYPVGLLLLASALLPLPLLFSRGLGAYLAQAAPVWLLVGAGTAFGLAVYPRLRPEHPLRRAIGRLSAAVPFGRSAAMESARAAYADVLGAALGAGVPLREAVVQASQASSHPAFAGSGARVLAALDKGQTLAQALGDRLPFTAADLDRVSVAEQTGTLEPALAGLARDHDAGARRAVLLGMGSLTAVMALLVAGLLAWRIVDGWQAIFRDQAQIMDSISR